MVFMVFAYLNNYNKYEIKQDTMKVIMLSKQSGNSVMAGTCLNVDGSSVSFIDDVITDRSNRLNSEGYRSISFKFSKMLKHWLGGASY